MRRVHSSGSRRSSLTNRTTQLLVERLAAVEEVVVEQQERIAQQELELATLRAAVGGAQREHEMIVPASARERQPNPVGVARSSRRAMLKIGGAAAASVAASALALTSGQGARAAGRATMRPFTATPWTTASFTVDAETVVAPSGGTYSASDILQVKYGTGSVYQALANNLTAAIAGYDTTGSAIGLYGTSSAGYGLMGVTNTGTGAAGLNGTANGQGTGVVGISASGAGVSGSSASGLGGSFSGGQAPLALGLSGSAGAPTSGNHIMGEIFGDSNADLWVCVGAGSPGSWVKVAHLAQGATSGGAITYLSKPIRLLDTRNNNDTNAWKNNTGEIASGSTYTLQVAGVNWQSVQVPSTAIGAIGKVTVISYASGSGFVAIVPSGVTPTTGTLPYGANQTLATSFNVGLGGSPGSIGIYVGGSSVDVVIDLFAVVA